MTREKCRNCEATISTTADPNSVEGFFVSLEDIERCQIENPDITRGWFKKNCTRLSRCLGCNDYTEQTDL